MKLARFGIPGSEKPALIDGQGRFRDLSEHFADITAESLSDQHVPGELQFRQAPGHVTLLHSNRLVSVPSVSSF